jgi:general secretion pathway protein I
VTVHRRRPGRGGRALGQPGFTLLEVLVALAILSLAVVTGIQLFAGGLRLLKRAGEHQQATVLADSKVRELTTLTEGQEAGVDGDFTWERTIREAPLPVESAEGPDVSPYKVYAVTVQVRWGDHRSLELATLRVLRPPEPTQ